MENGVTLNFAIGLAGLALCGSSITMALVSPQLKCLMQGAVLRYYVCLLLLTLANLAEQLICGHPGAAIRMGLYAANFLEFLTAFFLFGIVSQQMIFSIEQQGELKGAKSAIRFLSAGHIALLFLAQCVGLYYVIDENNVCRRGAGYPLSYALPTLIFLINLWALTRYGNRMTHRECFVYRFYAVLLIVSVSLQLFIHSDFFVLYASIIVALVMHTLVMMVHAENYCQQEAENAQLKMDIMLNQIQPHFLYNTLTAIQELCHSDPAQAEAAIVKFSRYLRGNMDSLRAERAIPFEEELKHTRIYLELEQMRFEDKLKVRYDIRCADFELPALSLQPIIENAVRHGVRGNADGAGVVTIATREYPDRYEISVTDDGPGFCPDDLPQDARRPHIGIKNVRERLARMRGGTLDIASGAGQGTTVTIALPKTTSGKEKENVDFRIGRRAKSVEYPVPGDF